MTMTLMELPRARASANGSVLTPAERLRRTTAAVRLSFTWFGTRKSLTSAQKADAAEPFGAERDYLSAGKKLLDTKHPAYRALTALRGKAQAEWKRQSLPFPEPGIRLLRQEQVETFDAQFVTLRREFDQTARVLEDHYAELKEAARQRLGRLYNPADYPDSLEGLFRMEWDFPAVEPPSYLEELSPALYEQERRRAAARFDEAVRLAEEAFTAELAGLVRHLSERLSGQEDGKPKVFRDSAVENLTEFFRRFRQLSVRSDAELDDLVQRAQLLVQGVEPQELRSDLPLRQQLADQLDTVRTGLDQLMRDKPRRKIVRSFTTPDFTTSDFSPAEEG